jgi:WD40 repeat protein
VAIADAGGVILLWDVLTNSVVSRFASKNGGFYAVRFSRDGQFLAAGGDDGSVAIWAMKNVLGNNTPLYVFRDHKTSVTAIALTTDMTRCVSADKSGRIIVRNLLSNRVESTFQGHIGEISGLELLADARFLFSSAKDGAVKVWQLGTEPMVSSSIEGHPAAVTAMALEISGRRLVTGCADGVVRAWELLWNYQFPGWQPVTAEAKSVLRTLLSLYAEEGGKPKIDDVIASRIILEMGYCGFGTIPSETIRQVLEEILVE